MNRAAPRELLKALAFADKQVEGSFALTLAREVRFLTAENQALKDLLRNPDQPEAPSVMKDDGQFDLPAAPSNAKAGERPCRCGHDRAEHFETGGRLDCRPDGDARNCPCDGFSPAAKPETKEK
jgi:hypothetical protein